MRRPRRHSLSCRLLLCLAVGATALPLPAREPSVEQRLFGIAEVQARQGNLASAVPDLERVLKLNPRHTGARFFLGLYKLKQGETAEARRLLEGVGNDPEYGSRARRHLQEIQMGKMAVEDVQSIRTYLVGGAFPEALRDCRRALARSPGNPELLYLGVIAGAMADDRQTANAMLQELAAVGGSGVADLQHFLEAWFSRETAPRVALEKLLGIRDRNLMLPAVHKAIRDLTRKLNLHEEYERFLAAELKRPGSDRVGIERELVRYYIDRGLFQKGIALIEAHPVDSIEDNLLLVELHTLAGEEAKARRLARTLLQAGREQDLVRVAWMKAFLHEWERLGAPPSGPDESGGTIDEFVRENVVSVMKAQGDLSPERMLTALRVAVSVKEAEFIKPILEQVMQLRLVPELMADAAAVARDLSDNDQRDLAIRFLEWMLAQEPEDIDTQRLLAENYYLEGRTEESIRMLEGVLAKKPDSVRTFFLLIDAMVSAGKTGEAHQRIIERLRDPKLEPLPRRQLETKALMLAGGQTAASTATTTDTSSDTSTSSSTDSSTATPTDSSPDASTTSAMTPMAPTASGNSPGTAAPPSTGNPLDAATVPETASPGVSP